MTFKPHPFVYVFTLSSPFRCIWYKLWLSKFLLTSAIAVWYIDFSTPTSSSTQNWKPLIYNTACKCSQPVCTIVKKSNCPCNLRCKCNVWHSYHGTAKHDWCLVVYVICDPPARNLLNTTFFWMLYFKRQLSCYSYFSLPNCVSFYFSGWWLWEIFVSIIYNTLDH